MKNGEKQYSLRGLNSVLFGFLLIMLTGIIGSAAKGILALNVTDPKYAVYTNIGITAIGGLLSWILIIAGLSAVKDVSHKFRNARKYYIIKFVGNFAGIGLIALTAYLVAGTVAGGLSTGSVDDAFNLGTKAMAIIGVTVVVALIIWIVSLLAIKNLLGGCADVAMEHGDKPYSRKCTRLWVGYILLNILMAAGSLSIILFIYKVITKIGNMENSFDNMGGLKKIQEVSGLGTAQIYGVIALIVVLFILAFFIQIMVMVRIRGTYKRFHNIPVKIAEKPSDKQSKAETGNLSKLHPFAKKVNEGEPSPLDTIQSGGTLSKMEEAKMADNAVGGEGLNNVTDKAADKLSEEASAKAIDKLFEDVLKKEEELSDSSKAEVDAEEASTEENDSREENIDNNETEVQDD